MDFQMLSASTDAAVLASCADPAELDGRAVRVLFAEPWSDTRIGSLRTDLTQPMAYLPLSEMAGALTASTLRFSGQDFDVVGIEPDGTGWVGLVLRAAQ